LRTIGVFATIALEKAVFVSLDSSAAIRTDDPAGERADFQKNIAERAAILFPIKPL